ncbi:PepSY domain-containing protein [Cognatilysobacter segetis]|uniref:PepSY domain-containing protein n=1 Tax=Cognatilysobacter segetis TaxID=2492394 RepID=UPI00105F7E66|nr:PepSY domain-containing protein [Lysobacter segetis]
MKTLTVAMLVAFAFAASPTAFAANPGAAPLLSKARAESIALGRVAGGTIRSAELETEMHRRVWSFDIERRGHASITEVLVDASNGRVLKVHEESPAAERAELRAEHREHTHK